MCGVVTSGLSLVAVRLRLSWARLRSSKIAAYHRSFAELAAPAGLGSPPYGRRLVCDVWCVVCSVVCVVCGVWCGVCGVV